ncbi:D-alanyl-D-alanine carboxypeptidase [Peteryoungia desertarenae]|uniref:D-alanyl-D-alanine carboxypeptidase n=1 Tax=Peteryoungia desertarenae TaxID=1813451 RepID=A0ABX6QPC4_9HYPH|nr:D-alanyl-D-alanine carboxypeptidase [Peteryoungia desertarenae]QLF70363.1 D-alanyl-D-alanine carboxypeptidase [Peteryoungia desertarenae]
MSFVVLTSNGTFSLITGLRRSFLVVVAAFLAVGIGLAPANANPKYAGIVIDANTGKVLYNENGDSLRYPASLTKMMTLYMVFEALESGRISLSSRVPVSKNAAAEPPSKLGVGAGRSVTVEQAILALVTRSANDIATAVAEHLGGSERRFAEMMTAKARSLGMSRTTYRNAHGLPNSAQTTTARDQAILSLALRQHYPQYYKYFSTRSFRFGNSTIGNHNRLLGAVRGVDGIKTGYTRASGFNLATSAQANGRSIVAVVMGGTTSARRNAQMTSLVQRYLPRASTRGNGALIAKKNTAVAPATVAALPVVLPQRGPLPTARYSGATTASAFVSPNSQTGAGSTALGAMTAPVPAAPVPQPAPAFIPDQGASLAEAAPSPSVAAATAQTASIDTTTTASIPQSGWIVQVGTSPERETAMGLLTKAQERGGNILRSATPFTVAFDTGSATVYRARFGGFDDQRSAVNACNALKKKGIGCWAASATQ